MQRVYHPTLNAWRDVAETDVKKWTDTGWKATKPGHVDDSDALPVAADPKPATKTADTAPAKK